MTEGALARSFLGFRRADQIEPKRTPWLVEGWLVQNTLAGLVAASGGCKSFLAIDLACCIATGTPWKGFAVKRGPVCYLGGEGQHGVRKRIAAWERHHGISIAGHPLFLSAGLPALCNDANAGAAIDDLNAVTEPFGPSLVIVDTVARAMGGSNENSSEDMGSFIRTQDWIRQECAATTILSIHHTGNNPAEQGRARGSSAYRAALDSEFILRAHGLDEIELSATKCKDWAVPTPMLLRRRVVEVDVAGQTETSLILEQVTDLRVEVDKRPKALDLHAQGLTVRQIAAELHVGKSTVDRWLRPFKPVPGAEPEGVPSRPIYTDGSGGTTSLRDKTRGTTRDSWDSAASYRQRGEVPT